MTTPNLESAKAAVETLRAQLDTANGALEAIDRKAALVPAVLGAIAGIFITQGVVLTTKQQVLLVIAVGTGIVAVLLALRVLWARFLNVGPNAQQVARATYLNPADFNNAVAGSLAMAVDQLSALSKWKGQRLNIAIWFAAVTILLLAIERVLGGVP